MKVLKVPIFRGFRGTLKDSTESFANLVFTYRPKDKKVLKVPKVPKEST